MNKIVYLILIMYVSIEKSLGGDAVDESECRKIMKSCLNPDYDDPNFQPQECAKCDDFFETEALKKYINRRILDELWGLRLLLVILLCFTVIILILFLIILTKDVKLKRIVRKFSSRLGRKKCSNTDMEKGSKDCNVAIKTFKVSYGESNEKLPKGSSDEGIGSEESSGEARRKPRVPRAPSESICPDETQIEIGGYDNLALSTSTINYLSRSSTPACSPINSSRSATYSPTLTSANTSDSAATINTTVTSININSSGRTTVPQRTDVGRRSTP